MSYVVTEGRPAASGAPRAIRPRWIYYTSSVHSRVWRKDNPHFISGTHVITRSAACFFVVASFEYLLAMFWLSFFSNSSETVYVYSGRCAVCGPLFRQRKCENGACTISLKMGPWRASQNGSLFLFAHAHGRAHHEPASK